VDVLILRSIKNNFPRTQYTVSMNIHYADRLICHLTDRSDGCDSWAEEYRYCRDGYNLDFSKNIVGIHKFPATLPFMIDDIEEFLPDTVPLHDLLIAISVNEEILISFIKRFPLSKGIIIPIEESNWITPYGIKTISEICKEKGIEVDFPKPFCSFDPKSGVLKAFKEEFRIGKPHIDFIVKNGIIERATVKCSAPCGATYFTARGLEGHRIKDDLCLIIDKQLSSYPCTASTEIDREFQDSIIHQAVKIQRNILRSIDHLLPERAL